MILASCSLLERFLLLVLISVRAVASQWLFLVNLSVWSAGAAVALARFCRVRISILLSLKFLFLNRTPTMHPVAGLFKANGDGGRVGALFFQIDMLLVWWRVLIIDL